MVWRWGGRRWQTGHRVAAVPWYGGPAEEARCSFVLSAPWVLEAWLGDRAAPRGSINPAPLPSVLTSAPRRPRAPPTAPAASHRGDWPGPSWGLALSGGAG